MVSVTLSVSEDVKNKMGRFSDINWSGFIRRSIEQKVKQLSWREEMLKKLEKDKDFEEWCTEMGEKVNKGVAERLKKERLL